MKNRKIFLDGSIDSVDAIFFDCYLRRMTNFERYITKRVMFKYGVFTVRSAMYFCTEFFKLPEDAIYNLRLVCQIRPE